MHCAISGRFAVECFNSIAINRSVAMGTIAGRLSGMGINWITNDVVY